MVRLAILLLLVFLVSLHLPTLHGTFPPLSLVLRVLAWLFSRPLQLARPLPFSSSLFPIPFACLFFLSGFEPGLRPFFFFFSLSSTGLLRVCL